MRSIHMYKKALGGPFSKLSKASTICKNILEVNEYSWKCVNNIYDEDGVYALVVDSYCSGVSFKFILIAKGYFFADKMVAGRDVIHRCIHKKRMLLAFIEKANKIYVYDAQKCKDKGEKTLRGNIPYYEFPSNIGINLIDFLHPKEHDSKDIRGFM